MRTTKELLEVMLNNKQIFSTGLCSWAGQLYWNGMINRDEEARLAVYIRVSRPSKFSSFGAFKNRSSGYYWPNGDINPRIKWLKKHIKKNS